MERFCILACTLLILFGSGFFTAQVYAVTETVTISARVGPEPEPESPPTSGSVGGRRGGAIPIPLLQTTVRFSGFAYPGATVSILKNNHLRVTVLADQAGYFATALLEAGEQHALYTLYASDIIGDRSPTVNYPLVVHAGYVTHISGIRFAPTVRLDKLGVRQGDFITVQGTALPQAPISIFFEGPISRVFHVHANKIGQYRITMPLSGFPVGEYIVKSSFSDDISRLSNMVRLVIGLNTEESIATVPGNVNFDHAINLIDFSIISLWYGKRNPPASVDLNGDNKVDLADLSILAFYWTN